MKQPFIIAAIVALLSLQTACAATTRHGLLAREENTGLLKAGPEPATPSRPATRGELAMLMESALEHVELRADTTTYAIYGGIAVVGLAAIGGAVYVMKGKSAPEGEKKEVEGEAETEEAIVAAAPADDKASTMDAEKLLKTVARRAVQMVGPKLAKANMVRGVLETHVFGFQDKAKAFIASEIYSTVGAVLKEMEAEEAMVLFGLGDGSINVPPMSVLLAGLLSPVILSVSFFIHLSQVLVVLVPVAGLCAWAIWNDMSNGTLYGCGVPGLWLWMFMIGGLAAILACAHVASMVMISNGKAAIRAKADEMKDELEEAVGDGELTVAEIRKLFLVSSVLLEHALYVEDNMRRSSVRSIIGLGTIAWFLLTVWNFFIVLVYTFVPGVVAFHASAAEVAGDDYCGAWASVLTARLTCVLALLFVIFNLISMMQYISDQLVTSESYFKGLLEAAKNFDNSSIGIPVVQVIVKAFLLRGNSETLRSQIAHANCETEILEAERDRLYALKESLETRIDGHQKEADALRKAAGIEVEEAPQGPSWSEQVAEAGTHAIEDAKKQAEALEQLTRQELEILLNKIMEAAEQVRQSEALKQAMEQAEKAKEMAEEKAKQAKAMAEDPEALKKMAEEAQKAAQEGLAQAQEAGAAAAAQAKDAASAGLAQAQQAAKDLSESEAVQKARAQAEEALAQGMDAAKKAKEQMK